MPENQVNLDEISKPGTCTLNGAAHVVKPMSATMITVARSDRDPVEKLLTIVANRVPSLTADQVGELTIAQLEEIVEISNRGVRVVEQAAPNDAAPATTAAPTPAIAAPSTSG